MTEAEPPATLPALLAQIVRARPGHDAVVMLEETVRYAALERRSGAMARALLAAGAGKGSKIALLAPDGIFWLTAYLAALRIGALVTLVSTLAVPRELAHILRHGDAQMLIAARRFLRHDYAAQLSAALPGLEVQTAGALRLTEAPYLRAVWFDDAEGLGWAGGIETLLAQADTVDEALLAAVEAQVVPSDDAVIVYTSGSTSLPKAVVHTHWNITRHPPELAKLFILQPGDRMLPMLPAFWLGGLAMAMQVLCTGATLVYPATPDIETVLATIMACRVTRVNGWGDGLLRLRALAVAQGVDVDSITGLGPFRDAAGALIAPALQSNMLGMSETFAPHSAEPINMRLPESKPGASGRPVNGYERRVVDPQTGAVLPPGSVGELHLRGGALMRGFYKVSRADVFTKDGFYPTGDLVRIDEDDYLTFAARRGDMIKTRAANVSRLEVEAALNALPGVKISAVTGLDDAAYGQIVAAAVVRADENLSADDLRQALRETLSSYKIPRRIVFVAEQDIPRTATGKLQLHELARLITAHED